MRRQSDPIWDGNRVAAGPKTPGAHVFALPSWQTAHQPVRASQAAGGPANGSTMRTTGSTRASTLTIAVLAIGALMTLTAGAAAQGPACDPEGFTTVLGVGHTAANPAATSAPGARE